MSDQLKNELTALPEDVRWTLQRVDGFLDLHLVDRARSELEKIPAPLKTTTPLLEMQLRLEFEAKNWPEAVRLGQELARRTPDRPDAFVQLAYAVRRADGLAPAQFILEEAVRRFPDVAVISFNLACYECQADRKDKALEHLKRAFKLDKHFREAALEDEDLKPLWPVLE